jgi:hypothetical protein
VARVSKRQVIKDKGLRVLDCVANSSKEITMPTPISYAYITTASNSLTTPPGSPRILIHTRRGKIAGIYCNQPAKIFTVETQDILKRATDSRYRAFCSVISPQSSLKAVGGPYGGLKSGPSSVFRCQRGWPCPTCGAICICLH